MFHYYNIMTIMKFRSLTTKVVFRLNKSVDPASILPTVIDKVNTKNY